MMSVLEFSKQSLWKTYFDVWSGGVAEMDILELYVSCDEIRLETSL